MDKMKSQEYLISTAAFMIFLILTLPIYSASAFAASVNPPIQVYGKHKVPGFRAQTDITVVNVSATITEDADIAPSQIKILEDPTIGFDCTADEANPSNFICIHEYPEKSLTTAVSTAHLTVQIFSDLGVAISVPVRGSVTIDYNPPEIVGSVNYVPKPGGFVDATYEVKDTACNAADCANKCAGVKDVKFTVAGVTIGQNNSFGDGCTHTDTINLTGLAVGGFVGTKHVCIEMIDKFDQSTTECADVEIDAKAPEITGIGIFDVNGKPIKYTNGLPVGNVVLKFNITEHSKFYRPDDEEQNQEYYALVDASELSERPEHQQVFKQRPANCWEITENEYTCQTGGFFLIASTPRTISVRIEAIDEFDNVLNTTRSVGVTFDNTPPVATRLYSNYMDDEGDFWVRENMTMIMMDITETGAGMSNLYVFLDFSGFGSQKIAEGSRMPDGSLVTETHATLLHPTECLPGWTCKWHQIETIKPSGSTIQLQPMSGSRDDANNPLQSVTGLFWVDVDEPVVDDELLAYSNITGIGEGHDPMTNLSSGDALNIHLFVSDHSGIKSATANLTELIEDGPEALEGECEEVTLENESRRVFDCTWETGAIRFGHLEYLSAYFTFEDFTNHTYTHEWEDIEILARENETEVRWEIDPVFKSPDKGIDRLSWGLSSQRMFYELEITQTGVVSDVISIDFDPMQCYGLDWVNQDTESGEFLIKRQGFADFTESPTTTDVMVIELDPGTVPEHYQTVGGKNVSVDSVYVNCTLHFTSIVEVDGERALTLPEAVNVSFEIPVYNNPLGQNIGNLKDKIKESEEDVTSGIWMFVFWTKTILAFAREICRFIETLISLMSMWAGLKDIFSGPCAASELTLETTSGTCGAATAAAMSRSAMQEATDNFVGEMYFFCGLFISCRLTEDARKAAEANCATDLDQSGWCDVKKTWGGITSLWAEYASFNFLLKSSGALMSVEVGESVTGDKLREGLTVFSSDDFDPTRSWISSLLTACLPGIMLNLEKMRQIKCKRLLCWKIDVPNGRPLWQCDRIYAYDMCTYWAGQIFAAFPLMQFLDMVSQTIERIVKQPISFIMGLVLDKTCQLVLCWNPRFVGCGICTVATYVTTLATIITDLVTNTGARFESTWFDLCDEAIKDDPSYANIDWPGVDEEEQEAPESAEGETEAEE
jgi:hypothetical protein